MNNHTSIPNGARHNGPIRLLQIVENLNTGAVENWLYRMFAASTNYPDYHWTFFCTLGKPGRLDEKARERGADIIYSPYPIGEKWAFAKNLRKVIREGSYDVLHCHHDFVSAVYLGASIGLPLRKRIVHVHNTDESILTPSALKEFLYKEPMRQTCLRLADNVVGISRETLQKFTGSDHTNPKRDRVVYYGVDTSVFHERVVSREEFRVSLGFPADAKVMLFAGRMVSSKNPGFVVDVLAELIKSDANAVAVFAGAGPLEATVQDLAQQKQVADRVRVLGWRDDTATLMRLSDVLIFPRIEEPKEGLGLVLVEAQAAGLPILSSPSIPADAQIIPELFEFLPLAAGPGTWATTLQKMFSNSYLTRPECLKRVESSRFSLTAGIDGLLSLYSDLN